MSAYFSLHHIRLHNSPVTLPNRYSSAQRFGLLRNIRNLPNLDTDEHAFTLWANR